MWYGSSSISTLLIFLKDTPLNSYLLTKTFAAWFDFKLWSTPLLPSFAIPVKLFPETPVYAIISFSIKTKPGNESLTAFPSKVSKLVPEATVIWVLSSSIFCVKDDGVESGWKFEIFNLLVLECMPWFLWSNFKV